MNNGKTLQEYCAGFFPVLGYIEFTPEQIQESKLLIAAAISLGSQILLRVLNHWIDKKFRSKDTPNPK